MNRSRSVDQPRSRRNVFDKLRTRLHLEPLEDRVTPAGFVVDTLVDQTYDGGDFDTETTGPDVGLSLREAIGLANANDALDPMGGDVDGDTITFAPGLMGGTIEIDGNGELEILDDLVIDGLAASGLTIFGGNDGAAAGVRIFFIDAAGTGVMDLVEIANLTLDGGNTFNSLGSDGGAIDILDSDEVVLLDTVTISNSRADDDGGGIFNGGGTLTIVDSTIEMNEAIDGATGSGGGIASTGGTVTITHTTIRANAANRAGGGIEVIDGALDLTDVTLGGAAMADGNIAGPGGVGAPGNGGGLHVSGTAATTIVGGTVQWNVAALEGGGLWNQFGATMTVEDGTVIANNVAEGDATHDGGGGIFNNGGTLVINGTSSAVFIDDNMAVGTDGSGGGIFSTGGSVTIEEALIGRNTAPRAGGGIEVIDGMLELTNVIIGGALGDGNNATGVGGAAGNGGGVHITGTATTNINGGTISYNMAATEGGGLWNQAGSIMDINSGPSPMLIEHNIAGGDAAHDGGGGIFNNGGRLNLVAVGANPFTISNNVADGTLGSGGGIFNNTGGEVTADGITIRDNVAERAGGGIEDASNSSGNPPLAVNLIDVTLDGNMAIGTGAAPGNGGGLHVTGTGEIEIIRGSVINNTAAEEGGGLWNGGGRMLIDGTLIDGNEANGDAATQGGGGIFNAGGEVVIFGGALISSNTALGTSGSGGGIFNDTGGLIDIADAGGAVTITGNTANRAGGGIEDNGGAGFFPNVVLRNVDLSGNSAGVDIGDGATPMPGNGGGLHVSNGGNVDIVGGTIIGNLAALEGGGLWNDTGTMAISAGTAISANVANGAALDDGGGGIFNNGGDLFLDGTGGPANLITVTNNLTPGAMANGGGIFSLGGSININTANINVNGRQGIFGSGVTTVDILNATVNGNADGGLVVATSTGAITLTDSNFNNNDADADDEGDGFNLTGIGGAINTDNVTATGNDPGGFVDCAPSFTDIDSNFNNNDDGGLVLMNITGNVDLTNTTANNNDVDNDDMGNGITADTIGGNFTATNVTAGAGNRNALVAGPVMGNVVIDGGAYSNNDNGILLAGITGTTQLVNGVVADNNTNAGMTGTGLSIAMADDVTITGGSFSNNDSGIIMATVVDITATNVTATGNNTAVVGVGLSVLTGDSVTVDGGDYSGNNFGVFLDTITNDVTLLNNVTADNNTGGILGSVAVSVSGANDVSITGGSVSTSEDGVNISNVNNVTVTNLTANGNTNAGGGLVDASGLTIDTATGNVIVAGGNFNTNKDNGIEMLNVTGTVMLSNLNANDNDADNATGGDGINLDTVGAVTTTNVTATGNDPGLFIDTAPSFTDTNGNFSDNDDHGIQLIDIAGNVSLTRTQLDDNDDDNDGTGDGLNATANLNANAIGGTFTVNGVTARDTGGNQERGIFVDGIGGATTFDGSVNTITVTGHDQQGVDLSNGTSATFTDGAYSGNAEEGIALTNFSGAVSATDVTANNNTGSGNGEGLFVDGALSLTVTGGAYNGNELTGIDAQDITGAVTVTGVTANNNDDGGADGDGLFVDGAGSVDITGGNLNNNNDNGIELINVTGLTDLDGVTATGNDGNGLDTDVIDSLVITGGAFSGILTRDTASVTTNNPVTSFKDVDIESNTTVTFNGTLTGTGDVDVDNIGGGNININGGAVTSSGTQTYEDPVVLGANALLTALDAIFNSTISLGASNITVNVTGAISTANGVISGSGNVSKNNTGTWTLFANNTYSGNTNVNGGTLALSNANSNNISTSPIITVAAGATLDVTGLAASTLVLNDLPGAAPLDPQVLQGGAGTAATVTGAVTVPAGTTINPGSSPGILATGSVSFGPGSNFNVEINGDVVGTEHDQLRVTGAVDLDNVAPADDGGATLNLDGTAAGLDSGDTVVIIDNDTAADAVNGIFQAGTNTDRPLGTPLPEASKIENFLGRADLVGTLSYIGGDGNDVTIDVFGNDAVIDSDGNLLIVGRSTRDTITITARSRSSVRVSHSGGGANGTFDISANPNSRIIVFGLGDRDVIRAIGANVPVDIFGGDGNDIIYGGNEDDVLQGQGGNDYINGGNGDDVLLGGDGNDRIFGQFGNDILVGGLGRDQLYGVRGNNVLVGGDSSRTVMELQSDRDDWAANQDPANLATLFASVTDPDDADEVDTLNGGSGADAFIYRETAGPGQDVVNNLIDSQDDSDDGLTF